MSFLKRIEEHNKGDLAGYIPFIVEQTIVGNMRPTFAQHLKQWPNVFVVEEQQVVLHPQLVEYDQRTQAVQHVLQALLDQKLIEQMMGEPFPVTDGQRRHAMFDIDRSVVAYFGVTAYGQHLNGFVGSGKEMKMWIAQRAFDRYTYPGKLDQLVAGGLPSHIEMSENLAKECYEEAGISKSMASQAIACGAITYFLEGKRGIKPDVLYCYDLQVAEDFLPRCTDDEVDSFQLLPIDEVMELVMEGERFKPNCNLVIIDFLIRHGFIPPDHKDYLALQAGLHGPVRGVGSTVHR